jgi:hypothetical protein
VVLKNKVIKKEVVLLFELPSEMKLLKSKEIEIAWRKELYLFLSKRDMTHRKT